MHLPSLFAVLTLTMCARTQEAPAAPADSTEAGATIQPVAAEGLHISRATTCRGIADREPVEPTDTFRVSDERVYLWCEVMNGAGTTVHHVYSLDGQAVTMVELAVGGDRWRTWSWKALYPHQTGNWTAEILDEDGAVLHSTTFTVVNGDG